MYGMVFHWNDIFKTWTRLFSFFLFFFITDDYSSISELAHEIDGPSIEAQLSESVLVRRGVKTNPKSFSDIRDNIRNVISETLSNSKYFEYQSLMLKSFLKSWTAFDCVFRNIRKVFWMCYDVSSYLVVYSNPMTHLSAQAKNPTVGAQGGGGTYLPASKNCFPSRIYAYKLHH